MAYDGHTSHYKGYSGNRKGENVGLIEPATVTYEQLQELQTRYNLDITKLTKHRKTGQNPNTKTVFTQLLPPKVFNTARIDGIGTWEHTIMEGNSYSIDYQGKRYINDIIAPDTFNYMSTADKASRYAQGMEAARQDEYKTLMATLTTSLPTADYLSEIDDPDLNLKQEILKYIAKVEQTSKIPRRFLTLTLSRDAIDSLVSYEIGAIDELLGNSTRNGKKNYWGIGDILEAEAGDMPENIFFMIHCPYLLVDVLYTSITAPGFYAIAQIDHSPSIYRFVIEDGFAMDYLDENVGLIVTKPASADMYRPSINFTLKKMEVAVGTIVDQAWLEANNDLKLYDWSYDEGKWTDITSEGTFVLSTIDTSVEGIQILTINATDAAGNAASEEHIAFKVSATVRAASNDDAKKAQAELEAEKARAEKAQAELEAEKAQAELEAEKARAELDELKAQLEANKDNTKDGKKNK